MMEHHKINGIIYLKDSSRSMKETRYHRPDENGKGNMRCLRLQRSSSLEIITVMYTVVLPLLIGRSFGWKHFVS
jgi:hypothetical protein